ncbi:MAG: hypothetical protein ACAH80_01010 [Alphaproteobacteria bacterium]
MAPHDHPHHGRPGQGRFLGAVTPNASMMQGMAEAAAQTPEAQQAALAQALPTATALAEDDGAEVEEILRREEIRQRLLGDARADFLTVAGLSQGGYSNTLSGFQRDLNRYLQQDPAYNNRVVVIDPNTFNTGIALGMSAAETLTQMLGAQQVTLPNGLKGQMISHMNNPVTSRFGTTVNSPSPAAASNASRVTVDACLVVPTSDHAFLFDIAPLSRTQQVDLANRHEGWHCLDRKYATNGFSQAAVDLANSGNYAKIKDSPEACEVFAMGVRKEAIADIGATGDMIRAGADPKILEQLAQWRGNPNDFEHFTAPVIRAVAAKIDEMGVDNFRKLSAADAAKLYYDTVDQHALTGKAVEVAIKYDDKSPDRKTAYEIEAQTDPEVAKGIQYRQLSDAAEARDKAKITIPPGDELTEDEERIALAINDFDASKTLQDRAFEDSGKITPVTLIKAYRALQDEYRQDGIDDGLVRAKLDKLQQSFVSDMKTIDFVEVNLQRGVRIEDEERSLEDLRQPATAPAISAAEPEAPKTRVAFGPQP